MGDTDVLLACYRTGLLEITTQEDTAKIVYRNVKFIKLHNIFKSVVLCVELPCSFNLYRSFIPCTFSVSLNLKFICSFCFVSVIITFCSERYIAETQSDIKAKTSSQFSDFLSG